MTRIPLWVKIGWTAWMAVWVPLYWKQYGPSNFLWFCDIGNFLITAALWRESPRLMSMQACGLLVVQVAWVVDVLARLVAGRHVIGGTEYMFDPSIGILWRGLSLFHVAVPPLLIYGVRKLGYDRRGWLLQSALAAVVLPICFLGWGPEKNLNWVWGPFSRPQSWMDPRLFLVVAIVGYPLVLYLPTHLALAAVFRPRVTKPDRHVP